MVAEVVKAQHLSDLQKATILHELGAKEFAILQGTTDWHAATVHHSVVVPPATRRHKA